MRKVILHSSGFIHIFLAMNIFRLSRDLTHDWHHFKFKPQYHFFFLRGEAGRRGGGGEIPFLVIQFNAHALPL